MPDKEFYELLGSFWAPSIYCRTISGIYGEHITIVLNKDSDMVKLVDSLTAECERRNINHSIKITEMTHEEWWAINREAINA